MAFTISLPDGTRVSYSRDEFTKEFPESMPISLLEITQDTEIPITHPMITEEVLVLLQFILKEKRYPPVPFELKKQLDYLGIDLPEYVYDPSYPKWIKEHPYINLYDFKADGTHSYSMLLSMSRGEEFPPFTRYIFAHTSPKDHQEEDRELFIDIMASEDGYSETDEAIGVDLLMRSDYIINNINDPGIADQCTRLGYLDILKIIAKHEPLRFWMFQVRNILLQIESRPVHTPRYIQVLEYMKEHMKDQKDQIIQMILSKVPNLIHRVIYENIHQIYMEKEQIIGLMWICNYHGDPDLFTDFLTLVEHGDINYEDTGDNIFVSMFKAYMSHPGLVKEGILKILREYLSSQRS